MRPGLVALVGAGPGDPGLLTVRGRRLLRRADVVVYDRLLDARLLELPAPGALRIFAGKASGGRGRPQPAINALLIAHARRGRRVVRLKGGDPFVFGRGGEEAAALAAAGVPFEVVPGVSSAVAVAAYAGIPLTHRSLASSFAVVTGHEAPEKPARAGRWAGLATAADTLVVLMGLANLDRIARTLVAKGRSADTPVAVIRAGTTREQETVTGTLANIAGRVRAAGLEPPAVIIVGDVVRLRDRLAWFKPSGRMSVRAPASPAQSCLGQASEGAVAPHGRARGVAPSDVYPPRYARRTWSLPSSSAARPARTMRPVSIT
jgi:uroporphyrinogen III methyltransferase/synthase